MIRPFLFLFGYKRFRVSVSYAGEIMNICRNRGLIYRSFSFCGDYACFEASLRMSERILSACRDRGIPLVISETRGVPALLYRYRHRYGIFVGMLLFAAIVFFSGRVLWSIQIDGNETVSDEVILEELRVCGMRIGDPLSKLEPSVLENRMLIESEKIAWISINIVGTVAQVEVREMMSPVKEESYAAANLVAAESGVIEWFEDVRGNIAVHIGDVVSKGDLLVGGLYDIQGGGYRYTCAKGQVFARTQRDFSAEIPLQYEKKVYTGRVRVEKYLIFFEKEVKFFGNTGNSYGTCDTIDTVEYFELSGDRRLPIGIRTVKYLEYEMSAAQRSEEAAMELAYYRIRCMAEGEVPEGQLVRKNLTARLTEEAYILHCKAEYIEDIARVQKIEVERIP